MTDEQIRQNAEAYAIKICEETPIDYRVVSDAYFAGAHSRDVEIIELKKKLEDMTKPKNYSASSLDICDRDNKELQDERAELRNKKGK